MNSSVNNSCFPIWNTLGWILLTLYWNVKFTTQRRLSTLALGTSDLKGSTPAMKWLQKVGRSINTLVAKMNFRKQQKLFLDAMCSPCKNSNSRTERKGRHNSVYCLTRRLSLRFGQIYGPHCFSTFIQLPVWYFLELGSVKWTLSATCTSLDAQFAGVIIADGCDVLSWVLAIGFNSFLEAGCQEQEG